MLFTNIGLIDENFEYKPNMYVGTDCRRITYIRDEAPDERDLPLFGEIYDGTGKVLMPGFYNAHGHSPMSLLRGYGENMTLHDWLNNRIFPFEAKLTGEAVYYGTLLSMAESARFGIVSTSDMYMFVDDMIRAITESGLKANVARNVVNIEGVSPAENSCIKDMKECILMYHDFQDEKIKTDACIHAEYTNDVDTVREVANIATEFDVNVQVHVAETAFEVAECRKRHGVSPVMFLAENGLFDTNTTAAHCVWIDDMDREILRNYGVTVASNPISNLKLVSGICDVPKLYDKGINVAIGTDGPASNNNLDFFSEMKTFALLGKYRGNNPALMEPRDVIYSATRAGALAQGRHDSGMIRKGYRADLIVVDADVPNMLPVYDMMSNLVYAASGKDVVLTMVDGKIVYRDGEFKTVDVEKVAAEADKARKKILAEL